MKRISIISAFVAVAAIFASCENNIVPQTPSEEASGTVTITASFPVDTKVSMDETDEGLDLKWKRTDFLTVVGTTTEKFEIATISPDGKTATFTGNPVQGESFKVILSELGEDYLTRDFVGTVKPDNGDDYKANLPYDAVLENVTDYTHVSFTKEWAAENNATFSETGCLMLHLQLPSDCSKVSWIKLFAYDNVFSTSNSVENTTKGYVRFLNYNTQKSPDDGLLKAYFLTTMKEDVVPKGTEFYVLLETGNSNSFYKKYKFSSDYTIVPGKRNVLKLNSNDWIKQGTHNGNNHFTTDRTGWTAPYSNIYVSTPGKLIDGRTDTIWEYPYNGYLVYDSTFPYTKDKLSSDELATAGKSGCDGLGYAPFVGIINLGETRLVREMKLWPRQAGNSKYMNLGEVWVSNDTSNDEGMGEYLSKTLDEKRDKADIENYWKSFWGKKTWLKVWDFNTNKKQDPVSTNIQGIPAKYIMVKILDSGIYYNNDGIPILSAAELELGLFNKN